MITTPTITIAPRRGSELKLIGRWESEDLRRIVDRKTRAGHRPSFLFLGRYEANLLREHLGAAFGPESVRTLKNLYYMGMEVVEIQAESCLRTTTAKPKRKFSVASS